MERSSPVNHHQTSASELTAENVENVNLVELFALSMYPMIWRYALQCWAGFQGFLQPVPLLKIAVKQPRQPRIDRHSQANDVQISDENCFVPIIVVG